MDIKETQTVRNLVEKSGSYKLIIPEEVNRKIKEWCRQLPSTEWSGILFYTSTGSFDDNTLKLTCKDFIVLDIGNQTTTEFSQDPEIIAYMDENNLLDCYQALIHSHHNMAAFFSGTDTATLLKEANDTPHFLSLIVNNAEKYVAKITRRISYEKITVSYPTFNGKTVKSKMKLAPVIEAYTLDIVIGGDNTLQKDVETRIKELNARKKNTGNLFLPVMLNSSAYHYQEPKKSEYIPVKYNNGQSVPKIPSYKEPAVVSVFDKDTELEIKKIFMQLITSSITVGWNEKFDIDNWCKIMPQRFLTRFGTLSEVDAWYDNYIEYLLYNTDLCKEDDDPMETASCLASELLDRVKQLPENPILQIIANKLNEFIL